MNGELHVKELYNYTIEERCNNIINACLQEQGNNLMDRIAEPMALSVEQKVGIGLLLAVSVAVLEN